MANLIFVVPFAAEAVVAAAVVAVERFDMATYAVNLVVDTETAVDFDMENLAVDMMALDLVFAVQLVAAATFVDMVSSAAVDKASSAVVDTAIAVDSDTVNWDSDSSNCSLILEILAVCIGHNTMGFCLCY